MPVPFRPHAPKNFEASLNLDKLKKNIGWCMELAPPACHLDQFGQALPSRNEDWTVASVTDEVLELSSSDGHVLKLGTDHVVSFYSNPQRTTPNGHHGILALKVQVFIQGNKISLVPNAKPGERVPPPPSEIKDKIVGLDYPQQSGIQQRLESQGYKLVWSRESLVTHRVDLEGWHLVIEPDSVGRLFSFRCKDPGDDLILLKKPSQLTANSNPGILSVVSPDDSAADRLLSRGLIAIGPDLVGEGELSQVDQAEWRIQLNRFTIGDIATLIKFIDGFPQRNAYDLYVLVGNLGDGRVLASVPSFVKEREHYLIRCPVSANASRVRAQDMPNEMAVSPATNDLYLHNGSIARVSGVDALPQRLRFALSHMRGESMFNRAYGSRFQEFYWKYRNSPLLLPMLKLEVIRLASIPFSDLGGHEHTPFRCVDRVNGVTLLADDPVDKRIPVKLDLDVHGLGRCIQEISVLMPTPEKLIQISKT